MRLRRLPALVAATVLVCSRVAADSENSVQIVRPPLFGLVIEKSTGAGADPCRLVRIDADRDEPSKNPSRTTLMTGTIDACQEKRLEILTKRYGSSRLNLPFSTLGGKQVWADEFISCGWRVQTNVIRGHSRLLDREDVRRGWGSYEQCRIEYERQRIQDKLVPRADHLVLLIHGLFRSKDSFRRLASALEEKGFEVEAVNYPSTRKSIKEHADQLGRILEELEGYDEVSFVTHSLGGIVVRDLLARGGTWRKKITVRRMVMLGPPNRGSVIAELLQDWLPYRVLAGKAAMELTSEEMSKVPPPSCSFGIIAGGTGTSRGYNPALGGDNDGIVLVENTRLDSADDFLLLQCIHTLLMKHEEAIEATGRFLKQGKFRQGGEDGASSASRERATKKL